MRLLRVLAVILPMSLVGITAAAPDPAAETGPDLDRALQDAAKRHLPVLVEFHAPWCYSCYYMARHVMTGPRWKAATRRTVFVDLDVDSPAGSARMEALDVRVLPTYLVLDGKGQEIGRILGEQKSDTFYARLDQLLAPQAGLDREQARAVRGGRHGLAAAGAVLSAYEERGDAAEGIGWFYDLPGPIRRPYEADPDIQAHLARLWLMQSAAGGDAAGCRRAAPTVFAAPAGCERPYEVDRYAACVADPAEPAAADDALLRAQLPVLQLLAEQAVFGAAQARCADTRSVVTALADRYAGNGDAAARDALLRRAAEQLRTQLGGDPGRDRNAADNLRVYLQQLADWDAYDDWMRQLVAVWPDDYVYAYRFGRSLLERDRPSEALPYLERAAAHAYGENRLRVAELRVKALKRLGRPDEAQQVGTEALDANGPWFPEQAAALKALL